MSILKSFAVNAAKAVKKGGAKVAASDGYKQLKAKAVQNGPKILFDALGGNKVPLLNYAFNAANKSFQNSYAKKRGLPLPGAKPQKPPKVKAPKAPKQAKAKNPQQQPSPNQTQPVGPSARTNNKVVNPNQAPPVGPNAQLNNKILPGSAPPAQPNVTPAVRPWKNMGSVGLGNTPTANITPMSQVGPNAQLNNKVINQQGVQQSKFIRQQQSQDNAIRQEKAHQAGISATQKNQANIVAKMASDIHDIKGMLGKGLKGGSGTESASGGIMGMISSALSSIMGFVPKGALGKIGGKLLGAGKGALRMGSSMLGRAGGWIKSAGSGIGSVFPSIARAAGSAGSSLAGMGRAGISQAGGLLSSGKAALGSLLTTGKGYGAKALAALGIGTGASAAVKALGTQSAESIAEKAIATGAVKGGGGALLKTGAKSVGKSIIKKIPLVSVLAGLGFGTYRAAKGDWSGAGLEVASGLAGTFPGVGTAGSIAIDVALAKRDYDKEMEAIEGGMSESEAKKEVEKFNPNMNFGVDDVIEGKRGTSSANVAAAISSPAVQSKNVSTTSTLEQLNNAISAMLGLMSDEKQGIYVRKAKDALVEPISFSGTNGSSVQRRTTNIQSTPRTPAADMSSFSRRPGVGLPVGASSGGELGSGTNGMALGVYNAARKAGFSHAGARVLVGEVGRENSLNPNLIFGSHDDPANGAKNAGMISFQGQRKDDLMRYLASVPGALDEKGNMTKSQTNLDAQMRFMRQEMESGKIGRGTKGMADMLSSEGIDQKAAADAVGKSYIKWRIDDPKYREMGVRNREAFSGKLDNALAGSGQAGKLSPVSMVSSDLMSQTQKAIDAQVKYGYGSKDLRTGKIDCSGWVSQINRNLIQGITKEGEDMTGTKKAERLFEGGAAEIVGNIANVTGKVLGNAELTPESLKEGMIIGENNGSGRGRGKMGIDHVTQVIKDPKTGELMISQSSSSGGGVNLTPAKKYLDQKNARGTKLFGVDTTAALDSLTGGEYSSRAGALKTEGPRYAMAMAESRSEVRNAEAESNAQPIIVQAPGGSGGQALSGSQSGSGLTAPMITRNGDSSIRRLTDNFMGSSVPLR